MLGYRKRIYGCVRQQRLCNQTIYGVCKAKVVSSVACPGEVGPFMFFFSVGSTRVISVLASCSSYTLESASARILSFPVLCIILKS